MLQAVLITGFAQTMSMVSEPGADGSESKGRKENGLKTGLWITYDSNGNIKRLEEFKEGKRHGWFIENDEHGHPFLEGFFADGKPVGRHVASNHGTLMREMDYDKGTLREYYPTGGIKREGTLQDGELQGKVTQYYDDGKILSEGNYIKGKKTGLQKYYFQSGKVQAEYETADDNLTGMYREYHSNGNPAAEGRYENNLKQGLWKEYDESGKLIRQAKYKNDVEVK